MKYIESFFWGILAALGALLVELILLNVIQLSTFPENGLDINLFFSSLSFIVVAALVEEVFKYIVIVKKIGDFFIARSIILGSFLVGLSFSAVETVLICAQVGEQWTAYSRYLIEIGLLHISTAGIIGYIVAASNPRKAMTFAKAVLLMASVHFVFNLLALHRSYFFNYLIFILLLFMVAVNILNLLRINKKLAS
jgi:hypothetical protein